MVETISVFEHEKEKYRKIWAIPDYRTISFGEQLVGPFMALTGAKPGDAIVDVGCGTGRASMKFSNLLMQVTMVDATLEALDPFAKDRIGIDLEFVESCLWHDWPTKVGSQKFSYCCDVLEHIPQEFTMLVAALCVDISHRAFFHVNFEEDFFGSKIGEALHLTVKPFTWWRDRLAELGRLVEARDMMGRGIFIVERGRA